MANTATISWLSSSTLDPDAAAFITATGITDATIISAINTLVLNAKSNGWWTKCSFIYPFVGGTSSTCSYNLKNTATFQITWNGSVTFASNGITGNGSTGYGDTGYNPSINATIDDSHLSIYMSTTDTNDSTDIGSFDSGNSFILRPYYGSKAGENTEMYSGTESVTATSVTTAVGYSMGSRISNTDLHLYKNGSSVGSYITARTGSLPNQNICLLALGFNGGSPVQYSSRTSSFATGGLGISSTLANTMYNDILTFNTALGR